MHIVRLQLSERVMFNKLLDLNQLKGGKPPVLHVEHSFLLYHVPFSQARRQRRRRRLNELVARPF